MPRGTRPKGPTAPWSPKGKPNDNRIALTPYQGTTRLYQVATYPYCVARVKQG